MRRLLCILPLFSLFIACASGGEIVAEDEEFWFGEKQVECAVNGEIEGAGPEDENPDSCTAFNTNPLTREMYGNIGLRNCCQTIDSDEETIDIPEPLKDIVSVDSYWM